MRTGLPGLLMVGNFLSASKGIRSVSEELSERLAEAGWNVTTTSAKSNRVLRLLDMATTIWRRRDDYRVAQVAVFSGPAFLWAEAAAWLLRRLDKPYVLTLHGGNLPSFTARWPGRVRRLLSSAAARTSPSRYLSEELRCVNSEVALVPNALDVAKYPFRARRLLAPRIVWLRSFHEIYNPSLAPRVLAALLPSHPHATLTMVGPDRGDGSLDRTRELAGQLGVAERIRFAGAVAKSDVPRWLDEHDVFLNTTDIDNTPVSVLEAMACGLCVVSTNVGGLPYLLDSGRNALLVPPRATDVMAEAVLRLFGDPGLAERLSRAARSTAEQIDWRVVLPQWDRLIRSVAAPEHRDLGL